VRGVISGPDSCHQWAARLRVKKSAGPSRRRRALLLRARCCSSSASDRSLYDLSMGEARSFFRDVRLRVGSFAALRPRSSPLSA